MPPDAPVTSALRPVRSNMSLFPSNLRHSLGKGEVDQARQRSQRRVDIGRRADGGCRDVAVDAAREAGQHLAGADLVERGDAVGAEPLDRLAPAHPAGHLLDQPRGDLVGIGQRLHRDIGDHRHDRRMLRHRRQRLAHRVGGRRHQRGMEGRGDRQHQGALGALLGAERGGAFDRRLLAGDHQLAAAIVVGDLAEPSLRRLQRRPPPRPPAPAR